MSKITAMLPTDATRICGGTLPTDSRKENVSKTSHGRFADGIHRRELPKVRPGVQEGRIQTQTV